jgi:hypothetical protein
MSARLRSRCAQASARTAVAAERSGHSAIQLVRGGASATQKVDVRIIAATNRDLRAEVNAGRFRADLYFRLAVVRVAVPALRDRPDDLPMLAEAILVAWAPTPISSAWSAAHASACRAHLARQRARAPQLPRAPGLPGRAAVHRRRHGRAGTALRRRAASGASAGLPLEARGAPSGLRAPLPRRLLARHRNAWTPPPPPPASAGCTSQAPGQAPPQKRED